MDKEEFDGEISDNIIPSGYWLPDPPINDGKGPLTVNDVQALLTPTFG